jgi:ribosomal protein L12E/L44/L45/RPP1/RPP2
VDAELGSALTLTPRAAQSLLGYARELARLAPTMALLAAGVLDPRRAELIARHLEMLPDEHAAAVQDLVLPRAGQMTTGRLGDALKAAVTRVDPAAARRRREKAQRDARVECWAEESGTAALCGRDLPPAEVLAADKRIDAAARWLQEHGAEGTLDQLRAKAYLALLNGQPLESLLPATPATPGTAGQPAPASAGASAPASAGTSAGTGAGTSAPAGVPGSGGAGSAAPGGWPAGLTGTVHLTMPASAWAGQDDHPGEISGYGTADAGTCRDLAARLAAHGTARWCITLTDHQGRPVGHGCARAGPGPPGNARDPGSWLATVTITPIESGTCQHRREAPGYRIPDSLRHVIKVRSRRCGFPGCRRPAARCDDDHTVPYHLGGKSCECNLYPLCRRHHRCKQDEGWHLRQPEPGRLIWTTPSGRTYATTTEPYPI